MPATALHRAHVHAAVLCGLFACAGFAACFDPTHLDPAGTGGSAATSTGSAAKGCRSNFDCAFPKAVCDTVTGACVGCLLTSDCAYLPGAVCSLGKCLCPTGVKCGVVVGSSSSTTAGTGGAGTGGAGPDGGGTGGSDGGMNEGGTGGSATCVTCAAALAMGGNPCAGTTAATDYSALQNCAGCAPAVGGCAAACQASLCQGLAVDATCSGCLAPSCMALLATCEAN